jgi:MFS family permease
MASIIKQVFTERNVMVISLTTTMYSIFNSLWMRWFSLYQRSLGASITVIGLLAIMQQAQQLVFQFPGGYLADRYGRKKIIVYGTSLRIITPIIYIFAKTWQHLIPGMILESVASIYIPAFDATIAESLPPERRGAAYGVYRLITMTPWIFVPVLSGVYFDRVGLDRGMMIGFQLSTIVSVVMFLARARFLKETLRPTQVGERLSTQLSFRDSLSGLKIIRGSLLAMLVSSILSGFGMRLIEPFLTIYVTEIRGFSLTEWGLVGSVQSIISVLLSLPGGMFSDKYGRRIAIIIGRLMFPINRLGLILINDFRQLIALYAVTGILAGFGGGGIGGMGGPAWQALTADLIPSADRGKVSGLMATITGVTGLPAPYLGAFLWENTTPNNLLFFTIPVGVIPLILIWLFVKDPKEKAI